MDEVNNPKYFAFVFYCSYILRMKFDYLNTKYSRQEFFWSVLRFFVCEKIV